MTETGSATDSETVEGVGTPSLPLRLGESLVGADGVTGLVPRAVAVIAMRDGGIREQWQLADRDGADVWLEYDPGTHELLQLEPVETETPVAVPANLPVGAQVVLAWGGERRRLVGIGCDVGRVVATEARCAEPVEQGGVVEVADLRGPGGHVVQVRRTTGAPGPTTAVLAGHVVGPREQRRRFGRRLVAQKVRRAPLRPPRPGMRPLTTSEAFVLGLIIWLGGFALTEFVEALQRT